MSRPPTPPPAPSPPRATAPSPDWFAGPLGRVLEAREAALLAPALEQAVGLQFLQVGAWGARGEWLDLARAQRRTLLAAPGTRPGPHVAIELDQWPVQSDVVDGVLLPHTLDFAADPHAVVREAVRVLVGEGQLFVLGFAPLGAWHLSGRVLPSRLPTAAAQPISERRLRDWLRLLGCETLGVQHYLCGLPSMRLAGGRIDDALERFGRRAWPALAGAYLLHARKKVPSMIAVRMRWQKRRVALRGLAEPTRYGEAA